MESSKKRAADLGKLVLHNRTIRYEANKPPYSDWTLDLDEIRVVGEYSNDNGPFLEDLFCLFVVNQERWYEVPYHAAGAREVVAAIAEILQTDLTFELVLSSSFRSRVMWPEHLRGTALFEFRDIPRPLWDKLLRWWMPSQVESVLSPQVVAFLRAPSSARLK